MTSVLDLLISAYIKLDIQVEIMKGEEGSRLIDNDRLSPEDFDINHSLHFE